MAANCMATVIKNATSYNLAFKLRPIRIDYARTYKVPPNLKLAT